jgi:hypothetical protein
MMTRKRTLTEEYVHQAAPEQDQVSAAPAEEPPGLPEDAPPIPTEAARQSEELRMLFFGFGTGLTIAAVFLVYLVFTYANWLP